MTVGTLWRAPITRAELIETYGAAILSGNAAVFVGAGLSRGAGIQVGVNCSRRCRRVATSPITRIFR